MKIDPAVIAAMIKQVQEQPTAKGLFDVRDDPMPEVVRIPRSALPPSVPRWDGTIRVDTYALTIAREWVRKDDTP